MWSVRPMVWWGAAARLFLIPISPTNETTMSRSDRPKKTLARKLRDLEDHLHFLNESLAKLVSGDEAYLKPLAAELRVLACKSSGTDGLLWRILDELKIHDAVHVHLAGNLDRDHPLAKGLQFVFAPVSLAGSGDPRLPPGQYSLRGIIKDCEALVVSGTGYTHENLIRAVAEQMGSAHEDDGAASHLIELSGTVVSNRPALVTIMASDSELILEVGERALSAAAARGDFARQTRPAVSVLSQRSDLSERKQNTDFESPPPALPTEGTVMFPVNHPHTDWRTNSHSYDFGLFSQGPLEVRVAKYPDGTIEVLIKGLGDYIVGTRNAIPNTDQPGVMIGFTWTASEVVFYLCGERVGSHALQTGEGIAGTAGFNS